MDDEYYFNHSNCRQAVHYSFSHHSPLITHHSGFTLVELMIVLGLMALLAFWVMPDYRTTLERSHLPESGERLRTLITLARANAMLDGLRYRIRFPGEDDKQIKEFPVHDFRQPLAEVERDPFESPGEFTPVKASWATSDIFLGDVWCYDVRLGEPTVEDVLADLQQEEAPRSDGELIEQRKREMGLDAGDSWALILEPDGVSDWITFRLVDTPAHDLDDDVLESAPRLDVILDGRLGEVFLQRPLLDEEVEVLLDKGHSTVLRRDFLSQKPLTEDDVLEIHMGKN